MKKNPIDKEKISENPHLLEYAHHLGSAIIKPYDKGKIKGIALQSMYEQTDLQLNQIKEQIDLLARQALDIQQRMQASEKIYQAKYNFKPVIGKVYHLYRENDNWILSLIGPNEWGKSCPYEFLNTVKLLSDHTWSILK